MLHSYWRRVLYTLLAALLSIYFPSVEASHSHLAHHHHARGSQQGHGTHAPLNIRNTTQQTPPATDRQTELDISAFLDNLVLNWTQTDPKYNSSNAEQEKLVKLADQLKSALLSPTKRATESAEHIDSFINIPVTYRRAISNSTLTSNTTLETARQIVRKAQEEANALNVERFRNPRLNVYYTSNSTIHAQKKKRAMDAELFQINSTVATAAALVAEADAKKTVGEELTPGQKYALGEKQKRSLEKRATTFWMENIEHTGRFPYGGESDYKVYRNVKDYGAKGDGKTDDTAAINKAMQEGSRCGGNCGSSSVKGAIVYFPPGTYLISTTIEAYYNTQMVGDANDKPILLAAPSFVGLGVVSSDKYVDQGSGGQWYINQSNFFRQMRNFIIDVTKANMKDIAGLHWQVAQATSVQNVVFFQSTDKDKNHMGIFAENGSGGFMSDLQFFGGAVGIRCGNQQFTTRNFVFASVRTAIDMLWDWGWTWKSLSIIGSEIGIKVSGDFMGGSILVVDSFFGNTVMGIGVTTPKGSTDEQHFTINMVNTGFSNTPIAVSDTVVGTLLAGGTTTIASWTQGKVYDTANPNGKYQKGGALSTTHPKTPGLMGGPLGGYFEKSKPQYENLSPNDFLSAKLIAKGDGVADDTTALNLLTNLAAATGRPLYVPAGSYVVRDTVFFPPGLKIVGECWSQIVAQGAKFSDIKTPYVMIKVGNAGDTGTMEIQDLLFTNQGPTAGVVLMEWNMAASSPGAAAMWDSHFRIGGALGSRLSAANCPKLSGIVNPNCMAGAMLLHLTQSSSYYLENMWAWVADHDLDSSVAQTQIDIYVARGILIESQKPSWMYGTASEHCILYQYQLLNAKNIFMGMIQTESPYFFPVPQAPAPFGQGINQFGGDPTFNDCPSTTKNCRASWGVRLVGSSNIHIYGSGLYNWFKDYVQPCVDSQDCQQRVVEVVSSSQIFWYNLYTIGTTEMLNARGKSPIMAKANTNSNIHPFLSIINAWLLSASGETDEIDLSGYTKKSPCTGSYSNLDDIANAASNIPTHCMDKYIAQAEIAIMDRSLKSYTETINNGYDKKFKIYADQIKYLVPSQLKSWMGKAQASGFWKCEETRLVTCCKGCPNCVGCTNTPNCVTGDQVFPYDCPTQIPSGTSQKSQPKLKYTLLNADGFYKAIADEYGIDKSWITFGDYLARAHAGCGGGNPNPDQCGKLYNTYWGGFPMGGNVQVKDPKDLIGGNFDNNKALKDQMSTELKLAERHLSLATEADIVDAGSVPALLLQQGISSMSKVVEVANDITEAERKETIFNFIMGALLLLPGVGALLDAAAMTALRSVIMMLGTLTEVAMTVYDIVDDPANALWALFGFLMGGAKGNGKSLSQAAGKKRALSGDDLKSLSPIRGDLDRIQNLRTRCMR